MNLASVIQQEYQRISSLIVTTEKQLKDAPEGKLICHRQKDFCKLFLCSPDDNKLTYLGKKKRDLAVSLAEKAYRLRLLKDLRQEQYALGLYLNHHCEEPLTESLLTARPWYRDLLGKMFRPMNTRQADWMEEEYLHNTDHSESLTIRAADGRFVRSKSEALIISCLQMKKIAYRYEEAVSTNRGIIHPDFTIRHPLTDELYYWEHFGMMDKQSYADSAFRKMQLYCEEGYIPGIQLIMTFETGGKPLSPSDVNQILELYFGF